MSLNSTSKHPNLRSFGASDREHEKGENPSFHSRYIGDLRVSWEKDQEEENPYVVVDFQNFKVLPKSSPKPSTQSRQEDDVNFSFLELSCLLVYIFFVSF